MLVIISNFGLYECACIRSIISNAEVLQKDTSNGGNFSSSYLKEDPADVEVVPLSMKSMPYS